MRKVEFQKRHFEFLARAIADLPKAIRVDVANHFANELRVTNPQFKADRFREWATRDA